MILPILMAFTAGVLVAVSRQVNGRLSLSTSALVSSFWNHVVGFMVLCAIGLAMISALLPEGAGDAPWYTYAGGTIGAAIVALNSWLVVRIGAVSSALLMIGGQMISGLLFDLVRGASTGAIASLLGTALIIGGVALIQTRKVAR
ncbi:DMT family transporter [Consotaella aegiceratis]|uniref:DMT family transporter n=1 Tax=Consotaella aegiceratis TaxID=3097961 RepID=UPI002F3EAC10